jgi:signal transduction histidine kinase
VQATALYGLALTAGAVALWQLMTSHDAVGVQLPLLAALTLLLATVAVAGHRRRAADRGARSGLQQVAIQALAESEATSSRLGKQLESAGDQLHDFGRFLESILHVLSEGLVMLDGNGHVVLANGSAARMLGDQPFDEIVGLPLPFLEPKALTEMLVKFEAPEPPERVELSVVVGPQPRHLLATFTPVRPSAHGRMQGLVVVLTDRTADKLAAEEVRRANRELRRVDQLKNSFFSTVSHEFRTPLASTTLWPCSARSEPVPLASDGCRGPRLR